jgi:hypothetical protein
MLFEIVDREFAREVTVTDELYGLFVSLSLRDPAHEGSPEGQMIGSDLKYSLGLALSLSVFAGGYPVHAEKRPVCPLTEKQTNDAIGAWAKLAAFITNEPRCVNCHGGVNPYIEGTGLDANDPFSDPEAPVSRIEHVGGKQNHENTGLMDQGCKKCHDGMAASKTWVEVGDKPVPWPEGSPLPNWTLAPNFLSFIDKDATTLCRQIKKSTGSAEAFINHLRDDQGRTNFAGTAFYGNRGLGEDSVEGFSIDLQPPSVTHEEVLRLGNDWIAAMGGKFQGDESCGCEVEHSLWSGQIHYTEQYSGDQGDDELQHWSNKGLYTVTVTVEDGAGTSHFHLDSNSIAKNSHYVLPPGASGPSERVIEPETSQTHEKSADDTELIKVDVRINERTGSFDVIEVTEGLPPPKHEAVGKDHSETCYKVSGCQTVDTVIYSSVPAWPPVDMSGKVKDPNHVQGSFYLNKGELGRAKNGHRVQSMTFDLWRSGSSK